MQVQLRHILTGKAGRPGKIKHQRLIQHRAGYKMSEAAKARDPRRGHPPGHSLKHRPHPGARKADDRNPRRGRAR